jgi:outer membrane protein OmpA-like peptidoglycan-associated protein
LRVLGFAIVAASLTTACGSKSVTSRPAAPGGPTSTIVLLQDAPGVVGRAIVRNDSGSVDLDEPRESTTVTAVTAPTNTRRLSEGEVNRRFGSAIAALPPAPRRFTLFFKFESDELTEESESLLPQVLEAVKTRATPEVTVVGHTDTTGSIEGNYTLARRRAMAVRTLLIRSGLAARLVEAASHGERDPLVVTPDNTAEPKNRRVDIAVR